MPRKINSAGLDLIKTFEGCKLTAYKDIVGVLTIGYGHTGADVKEGMEINQAMADKFLEKDLEHFEKAVDDLATAYCSNNQFSALVSFAYNLGVSNLKHSSLLEFVNEQQWEKAADEFLRWNHAGGKVVAGLTRRREAERRLFLA